MIYKNSKYNFAFPCDTGKVGEQVLYNARTTSLSILDKQHADVFNDFCKNETQISDKEFEQQLFKCGCIVPENVDEKQLLQLRLYQTRFNSDHLTLTIAPTMNCNFRCVYCFEANNLSNNKVMDESVQQAIIELARGKMKTIQALHIVWYGGEPLLAMDVIEKLSTELIKMAEENNVTYDALMISNGYFLTKDVAQKLSKYKVNSIQVTIDGPKHIHDKRRILAGGQGTFDKLISNLKESCGELQSISLRINTDKDNQEEVDDVVNLLKENGLESIYCYLGFVRNTDVYSLDRCFNMETYGKVQFDFAIKHGFSPLIDYPINRANFCSADFYFNYSIDPDGYLYNCWNDVGNKDARVGSLFDEERANFNLEYFMKYILFDATVDSQCAECKLLPVCMGGCPYRRINNDEHCTEKKYIIEEYLLACVKYLVDNQVTMDNSTA